MTDKSFLDGNLAFDEKKRRVIVIEASEKAEELQLRVAAYARVSSSSEEQLESFGAQYRYYSEYIENHESWELADIYADEGIAGTSASKRPDFQRLLSDCRRGLVDRVLCKSISRFARNTKECLEAIRELKALGIGVEFEKENINTATMSGEMMTALFASLAQAESQSISGNMRWSYQRRMEKGTLLAPSLPFGYRNINGEMVICVEEALVICQIFNVYLAGRSILDIARWLNGRGIKSKNGNQWSNTMVLYVLTNERYIGDSLWQKTYMEGYFPARHVRNMGERAQYYAEGTHPAIIDKDAYAAVQELLKKKRNVYPKERALARYPLRKKLVCGDCGTTFKRKVVRGITYWSCIKHDQDSSTCPVKPIAEKQVYHAFLRMYCNLKKHGEEVLCQMLMDLREIRNKRMLWSPKIIELNKEISNYASQNRLLAQLKQQGSVDPDIFISRTNELVEKLRAAKIEKERLMNAEADDTMRKTREVMEIIEAGPDYLESFDVELFDELVDQVIVESSELLRFRLVNGLELPEHIERTVR